MVRLSLISFYFSFLIYIYTGAVSDQHFIAETSWPVLTNITCTGEEESLMKCKFNLHYNATCEDRNDAAVVCQGKKIFIN